MKTKPTAGDTARASDLLTAAADLISLHGLAVGQYEDKQGCLCVMGALTKASQPMGGFDPIIAGVTMRALHQEIAKRGDGKTTITLWSDSHDLATVLDVMRKAAVTASIMHNEE